MNEQHIREIVRDELTKMEVQFYSTPYTDEDGFKMVQFVGKLVNSEESNKPTFGALNNSDNKR